jgi:hypothetical protein
MHDTAIYTYVHIAPCYPAICTYVPYGRVLKRPLYNACLSGDSRVTLGVPDWHVWMVTLEYV